VDWQHLAEPDDIGPQMPAAGSTSLLIDIEIIARTIVLEAAEAVNVSMKLDHPPTSSALVKSIYILSDEQEFRSAFFHLGQCQQTSVWVCLERGFTSRGVPILDEFRIALKRFSSRELFRSEFTPD